MISKHGAPLLDADAARALREALLPCAALITPNAPEASALAGIEVCDGASAREAARAIAALGARAVLVKGGAPLGRGGRRRAARRRRGARAPRAARRDAAHARQWAAPTRRPSRRASRGASRSCRR
ncbi:MAG: bifunctional hydroxymethylpyrimidine kinase/phosphomethylpyrimidine kinase [Sandaracinaceae bacterium]|nr:bifunctional hydroxymethylpyrimidine kinase/phosphomethylpyrimidine kinase [Sandaracinaceae bacterium]